MAGHLWIVRFITEHRQSGLMGNCAGCFQRCCVRAGLPEGLEDSAVGGIGPKYS